MLSRFGTATLPFAGSVTACRWTTNHGLGAERDRSTGEVTVWVGRWELIADTTAALPLLAPMAMLMAFKRS